jgi:uncharacterized protein YndB with AHSA1/START domain
MKDKFSAQVTIEIDANASEVWDALVNPQMIKKYLHNTNAVSDWKEGSTLEFRGEWKGKSYVDKGEIVKLEKEKLLQYTWLSSSSGMEDKKENYSLISYRLSSKNGKTSLTLTQDNIPNEEGKKQSEKNWSAVFEDLKKVVEKAHVNA